MLNKNDMSKQKKQPLYLYLVEGFIGKQIIAPNAATAKKEWFDAYGEKPKTMVRYKQVN